MRILEALINISKFRNSYNEIFEKIDAENYLWKFTFMEDIFQVI